MRVPILVVALVVTPFLASMGQARGKSAQAHSSEASVKRSDARSDDVVQQGQQSDEQCERGSSASRSRTAKDRRGNDDRGQKGQHDDDQGCVATPPTPPPPPVGIAEIHGTVFNDLNLDGRLTPGEPGLAGWTVQLSGLVSKTTTTDATGAYAFTALPVGTYTVCQVLQIGWRQTAPTSGPACPGGFGWTLDIPASLPFLWYTSIDFGNAR
jgi:hypothetical protein